MGGHVEGAIGGAVEWQCGGASKEMRELVLAGSVVMRLLPDWMWGLFRVIWL
jgi:hypothetical protein